MKRFIVLLLILFFSNCSTWRLYLTCKSLSQESMIINAIQDFVHTSKLIKRYNDFYIIYFGPYNGSNKIRITIIPQDTFLNKYIPQDTIELVYYQYGIKYFLLWDTTGTIHKEINSFGYNPLASITPTDTITDIMIVNRNLHFPAELNLPKPLKVVDYFFCKCNYCKYIKVVSNKFCKEVKEADKLRCRCN